MKALRTESLWSGYVIKYIPTYSSVDEQRHLREAMFDSLILVFGCSVVIVAILFVLYMLCRPKNDPIATFTHVYENSIRPKFSQQSNDTHSTMLSGVRHILRSKPECPTVLLLLAPLGAELTSLRLAQRVARAATYALHETNVKDISKITVHGERFTVPDDFWVCYDKLGQMLAEYQVAIVTNFQEMNSHVASVLCHLTDDTYAPFPRSLVLLLVNLGNHFTSDKLKYLPPVVLAETYLDDHWGHCTDHDELTSIKGRVTGRSVLVVEETKPQHSAGNYIVRAEANIPVQSLAVRSLVLVSQWIDH